MAAEYLTELTAFTKMRKWVDDVDANALETLFHLWDTVAPDFQEQLPSFALLYNKFREDWIREFRNFKSAFLHIYYPRLSLSVYEEQLASLRNGGSDVCDFMEREAIKKTANILMAKAEEDTKNKLQVHTFINLNHIHFKFTDEEQQLFNRICCFSPIAQVD